MNKPAYPGQTPSRATVQRNRDAAFTRISRVRRLTILGAGGLTAGLAAFVSAVAPGRTLGAKAPAHARAVIAQRGHARTVAPRMPPLAGSRQLGLQAPGSAPQAAPQTQTQASAPAPQPQQAAPAPAPAAPAAAVSGGS